MTEYQWRKANGYAEICHHIATLNRYKEPETFFQIKWVVTPFNKNQHYMKKQSILYLVIHKNIVRHTAHTIAQWPNPKQWIIVHTSDLTMIIRQSMYFLSIIIREMGKQKTHGPIYCIMDNWNNMLNLTHTLDMIFALQPTQIIRLLSTVSAV